MGTTVKKMVLNSLYIISSSIISLDHHNNVLIIFVFIFIYLFIFNKYVEHPLCVRHHSRCEKDQGEIIQIRHLFS